MLLVDQTATPTTAWSQVAIDLAPYVGNQAVIRFTFDTKDSVANNFEGWFVDDVKVQASDFNVNAGIKFTRPGPAPGSFLRVAGIGRFNLDTFDDFAVEYRDAATETLYIFYGSATRLTNGAVDQRDSTSLSYISSVPQSSFALRGLGNIDGNAGADMTLTSANESFLIWGGDLSGDNPLDGPLALRLQYPAGSGQDIFIPLGDIDRDGKADLGALALESSPALAEDGKPLYHQVGHVFLGGTALRTMSINTPPDIVFQSLRANFSTSEIVASSPYLFRGVGDVNGNNFSDVVVADGLGSASYLFLDTPLADAPPAPPTASLIPRPFVFPMSTPVTGTPPPAQTIDLSTDSDNPLTVGGVFSLEGLLGAEGLSRLQSIGDINDDAYGDFLLRGTTSAYILLGPVELDSIQMADRAAAILVDTASLGQPAERMGDINGDGRSDLIFVHNVARTVTIVFGRPDLPRTLTLADAAEGRGVVLSNALLASAFNLGNLTASAIQWNQDGKADLLLTPVLLSSRVDSAAFGYLFSGDLVRQGAPGAPLAVFAQDPLTSQAGAEGGNTLNALTGISGKTGQSSTTTPLVVRVAGDVNGDGLEDVVFADPGFIAGITNSPSLDSFGRAYLFLGRTTSATLVLAHASELPPSGIPANAVWQGFGLGASVAPLGDIGGPAARLHEHYNDGYDDFAITRSAEDGQFARGSVFVFFGDPGIASQTAAQSVTTAAALVVSQTVPGQIPSGTSLGGPLSVTASDINGDGMPDLVIGQPESRVIAQGGAVTDQQSRGRVLIFHNRKDGFGTDSPVRIGGALAFDQADLQLVGEFDGDRFGVLPLTPGVDLDRDGIDDLVIGATRADGFIGHIRQDAGKIYTLYGARARVTLPSGDIVEDLVNRTVTGSGDFLVNPATGQPVRFDRVVGTDQSERWFRFTTLGDGRPGDQISITPAPTLQQTFNLSTLAGTVSLAANLSYAWEVSGSADTPIIRLTNTSTTASLTGFEMFILVNRMFDTITLTPTNGVGVTFSEPSDIVNGGARSRTLLMAFTNFLPGRFIEFTTDLDDPTQANPDLISQNYGVLSGGGLIPVFFTLGGNDSSDNVRLRATFDSGRVLSAQVPDFLSNDGPPFVFRQSVPMGAAVNQSHPELQAGGSEQNAIVLDTDFGGFLSNADDPSGILSAQLTLDVDILRAAQLNPTLGLIAGLGLQNPAQFTSLNGLLLFTASNAQFGRELWATNGTLAGTYLLKDINPGTAHGMPDPNHFLTVVGNTVYFAPNDGHSGNQLWKTDGTPQGTVLVKNLDTTQSNSTFLQFMNLNGQLVLLKQQDGVRQLWRSDGTAAGTIMIGSGFSNSEAQLYPTTNNTGLFLRALSGGTQQLYRILPPVLPATIPVLTLVVNLGTPLVGSALAPDATQFFFADGAASAMRVARLSGTWAVVLPTGVAHTQPRSLLKFGDNIYFIARPIAGQPEELFKITTASPFQVARMSTTSGGVSSGGLIATSSWIYFTATHNTSPAGNVGTELWRISQASPFIELVTDKINPGPSSAFDSPAAIDSLSVSNNVVYFQATTRTGFHELWNTDGTDAGTQFVARFNSAVTLSNFHSVGSRLYFAVDDGTRAGPTQLWSTTGSTAGTLPVEQTVPFFTGVLTLKLLADPADRTIATGDGSDSGVTIATIDLGTLTTLDPIVFDITQAVRQRLQAGQHLLTFRIENSNTSLALKVVPVSATGSRTGVKLTVAPKQGLWLDLYDGEGRLTGSNKSLLDTRNLPAGTYYLRVHDPLGQPPTTPLPFTLSINAPFSGQTHALTDRDVLLGGDGDDVLIGNGHLDQLFGESGADIFVSQAFEVRDRASGEVVMPVLAKDAVSSGRPLPTDPELVEANVVTPNPAMPDLGLRVAFGIALDMPVTTRWDGKLRVAVPIFASQINELMAVDAGSRNIASLRGLEYATNLRLLNLSQNDVTSIEELRPGTNSFGIPVGTPQMEYLALDYNSFTGTSALADLTSLRTLSVMGRPVREVQTYSNNLNGTLPEITGTVTYEIASITGFSTLGASDSYFHNSFVRSTTAGTPAGAITLTLTNLPAHTRISLDFLLAIIDSWDGASGAGGPDFFNVEVDGQVIFSHTFGNTLAKPGSYLPAPNVLISQYTNLGFNAAQPDSAFYMGAEPSLQNIPHTAGTLTVRFYASGAGWTGGSDESWGMDNLRVHFLDSPGGIPEISGVAEATGLQRLNLQGNRVQDISPLTSLSNLEYLYLRNNRITDVSPLLGHRIADDFDNSYTENTAGWRGNVNNGAFEADYRILPGSDTTGSPAVYDFGLLPRDALYELFVTWPGDASRTAQARYMVEAGPSGDAPGSQNTAFVLNQQFAPNGAQFGGRPWQSLGIFAPTNDLLSTLRVTLNNQAATGTLAADAVRLVRLDPVTRLPVAARDSLVLIDVRGNPLDNRSHNIFVTPLGAGLANDGATSFVQEGMFYQADTAPVTHTPVPSTGGPANQAVTISLGNLTDNANGWLKSFGTAGFDLISQTTTDSAGNFFIAAVVNQTSSSNSGDIYLAKFSPLGQLIWSTTAGSSGADKATHLAADSAGNLYVAGTVGAAASFDGGQTAQAYQGGANDLFVAKYNAAGALQWVQTAGGGGDEMPTHLLLDSAGRIHFAGLISGSPATFVSGGVTQGLLSVPGTYAVFVEQLNAAGALVWLNGGGGGNFSGASATLNSLAEVSQAVHVGLDSLDRPYVVAPFFGSGLTFAGQALTASGLTDIFIASLNTDGTFRWRHTAGGTGDDFATGIGFSAGNDIYLTGVFSSPTITFNVGESPFSRPTGQGDATIFLAKYNAAGAIQWGWATGSLDLAAGDVVDIGVLFNANAVLNVDAAGNATVAGLFGGLTNLTFAGFIPLTWQGGVDVFVARYDAGGNLLWVKSGGSASDDSINKIAVDAAGNLYVTGTLSLNFYAGEVLGTFEGQTVRGQGPGDVFILKYSPAGTLAWARGGGGPGLDFVTDMAVDASGNLYLTGITSFIFASELSTVTFDGVTRTGPGNTDLFLIKYDTSGALQWLKLGGSPNADGTSRALNGNEFYAGVPLLELRGNNLYFGSSFGSLPLTLNDDRRPYVLTFDRVTLDGTVSDEPGDLVFGRFAVNGEETAPIFYRATTNNPLVHAYVSGNKLHLVPEPGFVGSVQVRLTAFDGATFPGDFRGRSAEQVFVVNIGTGSAEGTKFHDVIANGIRDAGELPIEGWQMYVDANKNGQFDPGEPTTVTDAQGRYVFLGLQAGQDHVVAELLPSAWLQTLGGPVEFFPFVHDLFPGSTGSDITTQLVPFNGALYFGATGNDGAGNELWRFDGTTATRVTNINPTGSSSPLELTVFQGALFFTADDGVTGRELYKYDGTTASLVVDLGGSGGVWGVRPATGQIVKIDPRTGMTLFARPAPGNLQPTHTRIGLSMAEGGNVLLYTNTDDNPLLLYRLNPLTGSVISAELLPTSAVDGLSAQSFVTTPATHVTLANNGNALQLGINADSSFVRSSPSLLGALFANVDFLTPGTPQASWSVSANGIHSQNNAPAGGSAVTMSNSTFSVNNVRGFRGVGNVSGLSITRDIQLDVTQNFATIAVTLTNNGTASLANVAWLENLDPDQGRTVPGWTTFDTANDVLFSGRYVQAVITTTTGTPNFPSGLTMALGSKDTRAVASAESTTGVNPFDVISSPVDPNGTIADVSINLGFNIGTLAAGQSTTVTYFLIFSTSVAGAQTQFNNIGLLTQALEPTFAYLSQRDTSVLRQQGLSGTVTVSPWTTALPRGGLGGDDTGRQFGFFADGFIHEYDPLNSGAPFLSTLTAPAADIEGMAFDGTSLYVSTASGVLFTLHPTTGAIIRQVNVPGGALYGLGALANTAGGGAPEKLTVFNNALYFTDDAGGSGRELWRYDGSTVQQLSNISPGTASSSPADLVAFQSRLYFSADDGVSGRQLWNFNPTTSTVNLAAAGVANFDPRGLTVFSGKLYFAGRTVSGGGGHELWSFDGTSLVQIADLTPAGVTDQNGPLNLTVYTGSLYFTTSSSDSIGRELWRLNGTTVSLVADIFPGAGSSAPQSLRAIEDFLYFSADDGVAGREVWRYDDIRVSRVLNVGPGTSDPRAFSFFFPNNTLYFVASTPGAGLELIEARPRPRAYEAPAIGAGQAVTALNFGNLEAVRINAQVGGQPVTGPFNEGSTVNLSATIPAAAGLGAVTFLWQVTNPLGQTVSIVGPTSPTVSFAPADNGTFTVTLIVTSLSFSGRTNTATRQLFVANVAPTVAINGGSTSVEGANVALTATVSDPGTSDTLTFLWHVVASNGQSIADGTGTSFNFVPADNGSYLVNLAVTDDDGWVTTTQKAITVTNVAPSVSLSAPGSVSEGTVVNLTPVVTDAGSADTHTYLWHVTASNGQVIADGSASAFSFIPNDNGTYTVTFTVTDDDTGVGSRQVVIAANNVVPTISLVGNPQVDEGAPFVLHLGSVTDPGVDVITQIVINWGDGQSNTVTSFNDIAHTYLNGSNATRTISVTLVDEDGTHAAAGTLPVLVRNVAPVVALTSDFSVLEGQAVNLSAQVTDQGTESGFTFLWHVTTATGQVIPDGTASTFSFTPLKYGAYTIALTVRDDVGLASDTLVVTVQNVNPVLELGADRTANEGATVNFNGPALITDPGTLDTFIYAWVVTNSGGSVVTTSSAANFNFVPADNGVFTVSLTVTDAGDPASQASDTVLVTAQNVAPTIGVAGAATVNEGSSYTLTPGAVVDPGADTVARIIINWGDGSQDTLFSLAPVSHTFAGGNVNRTIRVDLVDEDGTFIAAGSRVVNVLNVLPSFDLGPAITVVEGSIVLLAPAITDAGADTLTFAWQVTRGGSTVATSTASSLLFTPADNGIYSVSLAVTDDTGTTTHALTLNAQNANPAATIGTSGLIEGSLTTFTAQVADPGTADTHTYQWELRDGLLARTVSSAGTALTEGFGNAVAISGNLMIVGSYLADAHGTNSGAAFVFERTASGLWQQIAQLSPSDGAANDWFGYSVAISGNVAVIGSVFDDTAAGSDAGSAWVFERNAGNPSLWNQVAKLVAGDAQGDDNFGYSIAVSGDTVIVGAWQEDGAANAVPDAGAAYVFQRNVGGANAWGQVRKLTAAVPASGDRFGSSVTIDGDAAAAGAPFANDAGADSGAAYVFARNQGGANQWGSVKKLVPAPDAGEANAAGDNFGIAVSLSGDKVLVGAMRDEPGNNLDPAADFGSAYLFLRDRGGVNNYGAVTKLLPVNPARGDLFGSSVAISGNRLVIGARTVSQAGAAYLFEQNQSNPDLWTQLEQLVPQGGSDDHFGWSVALSSGRAVVGANFNLAAGREDALGKVYVFEGLTRFLTGTAATLQFTPVENAAFRVSVIVTDDDGGTSAATRDITVANAAPQQVSAGPNRSVNEGQTVNLTATFTDPGTTDTQSIAWHVTSSNGQAIPDGAGTAFSFTPVDDGVYTVTLTVTDDDGGVGTGTVVVTANNVAPQANAGPDQTVTEGQTVNLSGSFTDPGLNDPHSFLWHVTAANGQSVPDGNSANFSFTPTDNGVYTVTLTVTDNSGGTSTDTVLVTALNRPPTVAGVLINYGLAQRSRVTAVTVQFSEEVAAGAGTFVLLNRTTGATVTATSVTYDSVGHKSTLTFENLPGQRLDDGNYRLTVRANTVTDSDGARMASDFQFEFHALKGDANGDRVTNDVDLYQVWQNLLKSPINRDLNEDLDGDGQVNDADVAVVLNNFLAAMPALPAPAPLMMLPQNADPDGPEPVVDNVNDLGFAERQDIAGRDAPRLFNTPAGQQEKSRMNRDAEINRKLLLTIDAGERIQ